MQNGYQAIHEFRSVWHKLDQGDVVSSGRFKVLAKIGYSSPLKVESTQSIVTIAFDDPGGGAVKIDANAELDGDSFHLDFSPDFQDYIFDTDSDTLVIEGSSDKMGGEYAVRIHPVR